jgi:hypothetical protein
MHIPKSASALPRSNAGRFIARSKSAPEVRLNTTAHNESINSDPESIDADPESTTARRIAAVNTAYIAAEYRTLGNDTTDIFDVFARINVLESALGGDRRA